MRMRMRMIVLSLSCPISPRLIAFLDVFLSWRRLTGSEIVLIQSRGPTPIGNYTKSSPFDATPHTCGHGVPHRRLYPYCRRCSRLWCGHSFVLQPYGFNASKTLFNTPPFQLPYLPLRHRYPSSSPSKLIGPWIGCSRRDPCGARWYGWRHRWPVWPPITSRLLIRNSDY